MPTTVDPPTEPPVDPYDVDKDAVCDSAFVLNGATTFADAVAFPVTVWEAYYTPFQSNDATEVNLGLATE